MNDLLDGHISDLEALERGAEAAGLAPMTLTSLVVTTDPRAVVVLARTLREKGFGCEWVRRGERHFVLLLVHGPSDDWHPLFDCIDTTVCRHGTTAVVEGSCPPLALHERHPDLARLLPMLSRLYAAKRG